MRRNTPKRQVQEREYRKLRGLYLEQNSDCERCQTAPATELHHKRGRVGADLTDVDHWAALCPPCHLWVTEHPYEACVTGWSEKRTGRRP